MGGTHRLDEMDFEMALTANLEEVYGLQVRAEGDPLNRRKNGYTTLQFGYVYKDEKNPSRARVKVGIEGRKRPAYRFDVDLADPESVETVADDCEALAMGIRAWLDRHAELGDPSGFTRREED